MVKYITVNVNAVYNQLNYPIEIMKNSKILLIVNEILIHKLYNSIHAVTRGGTQCAAVITHCE